MSTTMQARAGTTRSSRRALVAAESIDLAPLSAREAVGRSTGIEPVAVGVARSPLWGVLGITGLVALVAAGSLALIADLLSLPL